MQIVLRTYKKPLNYKRFFVTRLPVSRVLVRRSGDDHLSRHTIARMFKRPNGSHKRTASFLRVMNRLATDRVYHLRMSPNVAVGSYPTLFTFSQWVVLFLWHFP